MGRPSDARQRLIEATLDLMYARSYEAVGVADICKTAGVQKGSFYHFFPSKQALTLEVIDEQWKRAQEEFLDPIFKSNKPGFEKIDAYFLQTLLWAEETKTTGEIFKGCPFGNLGMELAPRDEAVRQKITAIFSDYELYFERALRESNYTAKDPATTAKNIFAFAQGLLLLTQTLQDPSPLRTAQISWRGL